ncbi:MAG: hypothetical protein Q7T82_20325 [Armatimonadota bacterium]|nr:hypothetical protein [Armatimonadota bacterium]
MNRRGMTMLEVIFASGLSLVVLAVGYRAFATMTRIDDVESRKEAISLNAQSAMGRIKQDVRAAAFALGTGSLLSMSGSNGRVVYRAGSRGLERVSSCGVSVIKGVQGEFSSTGGGVRVTVRARETVHRRPVRVEISSFVRPRNR